MPLSDVVGNMGAVEPLQIVLAVPKLNAGVRIGLTVTVNITVLIHWSGVAEGVNVYVPLAWLLTVAGFHVPLIPFVDVPGSAGTVPPVQIVKVVPKSKTGMMLGVMVTVNVVAVAHSPAAGVNVYVPLAWLSTAAGLHVPLMPLVDAAGKDGTASPEQMVNDVPKLNAGVTIGFTVTLNAVMVAHSPAPGVNV